MFKKPNFINYGKKYFVVCLLTLLGPLCSTHQSYSSFYLTNFLALEAQHMKLWPPLQIYVFVSPRKVNILR